MMDRSHCLISCLALLIVCLRVEAESLRLETVPLPKSFSHTTTRLIYLIDANVDGLLDLLVGDGGEGAALVLQGRTTGFTGATVISQMLPPETLWYTISGAGRDRPGLVHADGTAVWYRALGEAGWGEPERVADQIGILPVRTGSPMMLVPGDVPWCPPGRLPVVQGDSVTLLPADSTDRVMSLTTAHRFDVSADSGVWGVAGGHGIVALDTETWRKVENTAAPVARVDRKVLAKLLKRYKESKGKAFHSLENINGDDALDLVIYSYRWGIDPKTALIVFLRQPDGSFRDTPDQILRTRGVPVEWDHSRSSGFCSPFIDVNGDGIGDLLFTEIETHALSAQSILRTFIDASVRWKLTIRLGRGDGALAPRPSRTIPISGMPPFFDEDGRMVRVSGDFNGDGRPDLFVRRDLLTVNIFHSRTGRVSYGDEPDVTLAVPYQGRKLIHDMNADGRDDIVMTNRKTGELSVWMTQ